MAPKEKATELYSKFCECTYAGSDAKDCSLIAVDEIVSALTDEYQSDLVHYKETGGYDFWVSVKEEINKL